MNKITKTTTNRLYVASNMVLNNDQLLKIFGGVGLATIFSQVFVSSFKNDVYEPFTDYIFPSLFDDWVIRNHGKRDIKIGSFLRKVVIWLTLTFLIFFIFY